MKSNTECSFYSIKKVGNFDFHTFQRNKNSEGTFNVDLKYLNEGRLPVLTTFSCHKKLSLDLNGKDQIQNFHFILVFSSFLNMNIMTQAPRASSGLDKNFLKTDGIAMVVFLCL